MTCQHDFEAHIRSLGGNYNLMKAGDVYIDVETQIDWCTWQKAWQAALASQQNADDGWIEWGGGDCPVDDRALVQVKSSVKEIYSGVAMQFAWHHDCKDSAWDIIAYRERSHEPRN